jgi:hypothetical protein
MEIHMARHPAPKSRQQQDDNNDAGERQERRDVARDANVGRGHGALFCQIGAVSAIASCFTASMRRW